MILAIDVGNTNIKLGLFKDNALLSSWKMSTNVNRTADETAAIIRQLFRAGDVDESKIKGAILSSVIPQLNYSLLHALKFHFKLRPLVVETGIKTGMAIKYENPKELGSDRIVNCVAALKKYKAPFILVDFGTATTYNVVNAKGEFLGGAICAGIKTSANALAKETAQLPRVELTAPQKTIANTTVKAIQSGTLYGKTGETKYLLEKIKKELGDSKVKVIATGGLSELIMNIEPLFDIVDRELSLEGLNIIYKMNRDE